MASSDVNVKVIKAPSPIPTDVKRPLILYVPLREFSQSDLLINLSLPTPKNPILTTCASLSGPTSNTAGQPIWHDILTQTLTEEVADGGLRGDVECTILNPLRANWDSTWKEDKEFQPFREQTEWELEGLERADIGIFHLPDTLP